MEHNSPVVGDNSRVAGYNTADSGNFAENSTHYVNVVTAKGSRLSIRFLPVDNCSLDGSYLGVCEFGKSTIGWAVKGLTDHAPPSIHERQPVGRCVSHLGDVHHVFLSLEERLN